MSETASTGRIVKVAGPVVDIEFPPGELPEILHAVEIEFELGGEKKKVVAEVAQHLGDSKVRAIAMAPTDGLTARPVTNTGGPITVPVGDQVLGHIFNVWGESLDAPTRSSVISVRSIVSRPDSRTWSRSGRSSRRASRSST